MAVERTIPTQANTNVATFRIFSNGEQIPETIGVNSIVISKSVNKIPCATIEMFDGNVAIEDFEHSAGDSFIPGTEIEIKAGYQSIEDTIFKGIIIKHAVKVITDQTSKLIIELRDVSVKMTVGRKNKYFDADSLDSDIIEEIIDEYGLDKEVEATSVTHKEMVQYYATDWDFILSRAEVNGQLIFVDDGKITVKAPSVSGDPILNLHYGYNIFEFEANMDARDQYTTTKATSWDSVNQEVIESEGADPGLEEQGNLSASDLADVIGLSEWAMQHSGQIPDQEMQAWTDSKLLRSRLAKIRGKVKIIGFSDVKPGDVIELGGFGDRFNGKAFVSAIFHDLAPDKKWYTYIEFGLAQQWVADKYDDIIDKPASGLIPAIHGIHQGIVTNISDDPDGEGRIQIKIPIINPEEDGIWARITRQDAGMGDDDSPRGLFFNPEIGDEVVVGFFNDDPRDPVILGMLHSSAKPTPYEATEDNFEKGIVTRGQLKVTFNDDLKSITLETPNENKIVLSDDEGAILIEDENGNKIHMSSDGVTIESASDLNLIASGDVIIEGTNINITAQSQFKAEGSGGAELSTSGQAVIKGSIVQIN